jgi:L-alanine-DL-glutamate epimerase-like enolase superfamily enzyme
MLGSGIVAATYSHLLIGDDWAGLCVHENIGPLQANDCWETEETKITDSLCVNVPLYKDGYLYAVEGPGLGVTLNEEVLARDAMKDIPPMTVELKN